MKKLIIPLLLLLSYVSYGQLWTEDFSVEADNATTGTAGGTIGGTWNVTTLPSGGVASFSKQSPFGIELFRANQTSNEGVWNSGSIDISGTGMATISIDLITAGTNSTDYVRAYYKVDGGSEILFGELLGTGLSVTSPSSAIVSGSSLEVIVRSMENTPGNTLFGFGPPNAIGFDNVSIGEVSTVYSRKSSTWTDVTTGDGTWSIIALGGVSCDCTPTTGQVAIIGNGNTVTLPSSQSVGGVDVKATGIFQYNTNGTTLTVLLGLFRVESGGTVNSSGGGITGEQIQFDANVGGANFQIDGGATATIEDFVLGANASNLHYITGGGTLSITDDILIQADGATLTNDMTTSVAVTDRIEFSTGINNSTFVNNGTITAATLIFDDDNNFFTNASTATFSGNLTTNGAGDDNNTITNNSSSILNFVSLDANGADLTILNSGTINQSGTFVAIPNNANAFNDVNNLAGATWNYSGTGHDTDVRLLANNPTNTFNYGLSGAQQIITPVTGNGYNNLTLQSASVAAKTALGSFSVSGNYTRSGSATFANGGFTVTLNGSASAQMVSAVGGETFAGLTINNSTGSSPQITLNNAVTVTGVLTMTDGNVHLNGNLFTLSSSTSGALVHSLASTAGWMYGAGSGSRISRAFRATGGGGITIGTVDGLIPIGTATNFRPFFFGKPSSAGTSGTIAVNHGDPGTTTTGLTITDGASTIILRNNSAWVSTLTGGGAAAFSIRYGGTGLGTVTNLAHLRSMLVNSVTNTHVAATGSLTDPRAQRSGLAPATMSNTFYIGSINAASPLPIELLYFNAKLNNDIVDLSWATAAELDNDFFTIERAVNVEEFETIGDPIDGKGTTNEKSEYTTQDENPIYGRSYYRLKQTDFDGKFSYSDVQVINYEGPRFSVLRVYPNPSEGQTVSIEVTGLKDQPRVPVQIYNTQGQKVYDRVFEVSTPGTLKQDLELGSPLKQGLYIIKAGQTLQLTQKLIVE